MVRDAVTTLVGFCNTSFWILSLFPVQAFFLLKTMLASPSKLPFSLKTFSFFFIHTFSLKNMGVYCKSLQLFGDKNV